MIGVDKLRQIVITFDLAISPIAQKYRSVFGEYPRGSCGSASEMLGHHLKMNYSFKTTYCNGAIHDPEFHSHAWLEFDSLIIDITCGQFEDFPYNCPYVGLDDRWHSKWNAQRRPIMEATGGMEYWGPAYQELTTRIQS